MVVAVVVTVFVSVAVLIVEEAILRWCRELWCYGQNGHRGNSRLRQERITGGKLKLMFTYLSHFWSDIIC